MMKIEELFSNPADVDDMLADYDYPDNEYLNALGIIPTEEDSFEDLSVLFDLARLHGISPEIFSDVVKEDVGIYMINTEKYARAVAIMCELNAACSGNTKCNIKYWEVDKSLSVFVEANHIDICGFDNVMALSRSIGAAHSVSFDLTNTGTVRVDISIIDAAQKCEVG